MTDNRPKFISMEEARTLLADYGLILNERQIRRAASPNAAGKRKLPFFVDPVDGCLKTERRALLRVYVGLIKRAEQDAHFNEVSRDERS